MDKRWVEVSRSEFDWERRALDHLRSLLPEAAPYRVWSNAAVVYDPQRAPMEIDAIVLTRFGIVVLEIKSWTGVLRGDAQYWQQNHRAAEDNPCVTTDRKAKRLKGRLERTAAARKIRLPWVAAALWLSETGPQGRLEVRLSQEGRAGVYGTPGDAALPSVTDYLLSRDGGTARGADAVTPDVEAAVVRAMKEIGLRERLRPTLFGSWRLGEDLASGGDSQDFLARSVALADEPERRIRIYPVGAAADADRAERLRRAAQREYRLLRGIDHPGIPAALDYAETELGPAVMFTYDKRFTRLDVFLHSELDGMGAEERLALLRAIAETVQYAHRRDLTHRALSPWSIWVRRVRPDEPDMAAGLPFAVQVRDWVAGSRSPGAALTGAVTATRHVAELLGAPATAFLAPESLNAPADQPGVSMDVFSLGAVGYLLLTAAPPAGAFGTMFRRLRDQGALRPSTTGVAVAEDVDRLIAHATAADVAARTPDVAAFLAELDSAAAGIAPVEPSPVATVLDPLTSSPGDELEGGFRVLRRLGSGATAVGLMVQRDDTTCVLKVARDDAHSDRLRSEAGALEALRTAQHPGIVRLLDGPLQVGGRLALVLTFAGDRTLDDVIREQGRLQPEFLRSWGADLIETLQVLERTGTVHRDIKPGNLGVAERAGKGRRLGLVLYDFSLVSAPLERVELGTPPYLDPFLGSGLRPRWDDAAERYAVAVTLYQMATGTTPRYGRAGAHPLLTEDDVDVDSERLDRGFADALTALFTKALARDVRKRYGSAAEMREAWLAALAEERPTTAPTPDLTRESPIGAAGLPRNVVTALERLGVTTVGEAVDLPPAIVHWQPGVGGRTRAQIVEALETLNRTVPAGADVPRSEPTVLDRAAEALVTDTLDRQVAEAMLGLGDERSASGAWSGGRDMARTLAQSQGAVRRAMTALARHWRTVDALTEVRRTTVALLEESAGVMAADDLVTALLDRIGSAVAEPLRSRLAAAVLRAAVEAEQAGQAGQAGQAADQEPMLAYLRLDDADRTVLVAGAGADGTTVGERLTWAQGLGEVAAALAATDVLPTAASVEQSLREAAAALGMPGPTLRALSAERLVRLAVAASGTADMTPRLEVYPVGMPAERALRLATDALVGAGSLTEQDVRERVRGRFPRADDLPDRVALDGLLEAAQVPLRWDEATGLYVSPAGMPTVSGLTSTGTRTRLGSLGSPGSVVYRRLEDEVAATDERLERSLREGGWLVLTTTGRRLPEARRALASFEVAVVDVESVLIDGMREFARQQGIDWEVVLEADAAPDGSADRRNLQIVADAGIGALRRHVARAGPAVMLVNAGILARYDPGLTVLGGWREEVRSDRGGGGLRTLWLLLPWRDLSVAPTVDGVAVPVLGHGEYMGLRLEWTHARLARARGDLPRAGLLGGGG